MKKFLAFIFAFVTAALLCVAPALSQPAPQDEVVWFQAVRNVTDIVLSPDGTKLYDSETPIGNDTCFIRERNAENGEIIRTFVTHDSNTVKRNIIDLEITGDGKYLAACYNGICPIVVFNLQTGEEKYLKPDTSNYVGLTDISISPDSRIIVGINKHQLGDKFENNYITAFNLVTGQMSYFRNYYTNDSTLLYAVEYSPDNTHLVMAGETWHDIGEHSYFTKELQVWNTQTLQFEKKINVNFYVTQPGGSTSNYLTLKFSTESGLLGFSHDDRIDFYDYQSWDTVANIKYSGNLVGIYDFSYDRINGQNVFVCGSINKNYNMLTTKIMPQEALQIYETKLGNSIISPDNQYIYGTWIEGIYKLNAYWEPSGLPPTIQQKEMMTIYPNPVKNILTINADLPKSGTCKVTLTDFYGKTIAVLFDGVIDQNKTISCDTKSLADGYYFVTLQSKQISITKKFVKGN